MITISIITVILAVGAGAAAYLYYHPQIIISGIQKMLYKDGRPINSFAPFAPAMRRVKENGQLYVTEIGYGTDYPNSYLDITYPNEDTAADRPTVIYFHGGGFFGGDKSMGDPMAVDDDANRLFEEVVANGFNFVNVNYALVPDCHFPVPLIQMNQAIAHLKEHAAEYGLNMGNVVIFGQSAGAILTAQYGALMANPEYRELLDITPTLSSEEVKALIIDDAPFQTENYNWKLRVMTGAYIQTMNMRSETAKKTNAYRYMTKDYCPSFLTAGNTDGFPEDMSAFAKRLEELGVEHEYYFTPREVCELPHGYLNLVKENEYARECFDHILSFMKKYTGGEYDDGCRQVDSPPAGPR
ncbi:MAG: alpha/beta hydrolase [bacterium]|nr:alpha/beta hydrolase [bacterium]